MTWRRGCHYRHKRFLDCCIEVAKIQYLDGKRIKFRGHWINIGFTGKPWYVDMNRSFELLRRDFRDWDQINPDTYRRLP